jgi:hypothetical protein
MFLNVLMYFQDFFFVFNLGRQKIPFSISLFPVPLGIQRSQGKMLDEFFHQEEYNMHLSPT